MGEPRCVKLKQTEYTVPGFLMIAFVWVDSVVHMSGEPENLKQPVREAGP